MTKEELKSVIMERFRELSTEMGIKRITIDMIARQCGISKKTFYTLFPSKDEIVDTILNDMLSQYSRDLNRIDKDITDPLKKLYLLLELPFSLFGNISTVLLQDITQLYPHIERRMKEVRDKHREVFIKTYTSGCKAGYFREINLPFITSFIAGAGERVLNSEFILKNNMTIKEVISNFQEIMLSGILKDKKK